MFLAKDGTYLADKVVANGSIGFGISLMILMMFLLIIMACSKYNLL
jgi:hypothetical protein